MGSDQQEEVKVDQEQQQELEAVVENAENTSSPSPTRMTVEESKLSASFASPMPQDQQEP